MARTKFSLPVERQKAKLKSKIITHRVKIAEHREGLANARNELAQLKPPPKKE